MLSELQSLIKEKRTDRIKELVHSSPDILDQVDESGATGFMIMAYAGLAELRELAISEKKSFSFHEAIVAGHLERVQEYLETSDEALANEFSPDGFAPVALAAFFDQDDIAKYLLLKGGDTNLSARNPSKVNALHAAVAKENYGLCQLVLENYGAKVDSVQSQNVTPLHSAVHRGNLELVQLLVSHGASIHMKMDNGDTALTIAENEGHSEILRLLNQQ